MLTSPPPTSRALPSSPESPLWNPWFPGPQVTINDLTLCSTGKGRLKQGTYSWSLSGVVTSTRDHIFLLLVPSHRQSLLQTPVSYILQDRHFLSRTQSLEPLCHCTCCSLCLACPSSPTLGPSCCLWWTHSKMTPNDPQILIPIDLCNLPPLLNVH